MTAQNQPLVARICVLLMEEGGNAVSLMSPMEKNQ